MSGNATAVLVAVAGVLGTLTSPILTQRLTLRAKQQEIEALKQQRLEERVEERQRTAFKDGRDCCIALNTAARVFRQALKNCLFEGYDEDGTELEQARRLFTNRYGEAQIILSDAVMEVAAPMYNAITAAYGGVKSIGTPLSVLEGQAEIDRLMKYLNNEVDDSIRKLRKAMRNDLGIAEARK